MSVGAESVMERISQRDCSVLGMPLLQLCVEYLNLQDKQDDLEMQLYITAGVLGGIALLLLILIISLFVKLHNGFKRLYEGDVLQKRGFNTYTGRPIVEPTSPGFSPSPPPFPMPFDNATAGGVRVLPRNPPILRNNDQKYY